MSEDLKNKDFKIVRASDFKAMDGGDKNFTGRVHISGYFAAPEPSKAGVGIVNFDVGARTNRHTHSVVRSWLLPTVWAGISVKEARNTKSVKVTLSGVTAVVVTGTAPPIRLLCSTLPSTNIKTAAQWTGWNRSLTNSFWRRR